MKQSTILLLFALFTSQEMFAMQPEEIAPLVSGLSDMKALHTTSAGVHVSQLLYSQSYLTGVKQVKTAEGLYESLLQKTEKEVIHDISESYYQVLMIYLNLNILNDNIQNLEKIYNILKLQYENDFVKQTDVSRLKVTLTNLNKQQELAELQVKSDRAAFYPNLAAFGQFSYSGYATEFKLKDFNNMNTIGLKATSQYSVQG